MKLLLPLILGILGLGAGVGAGLFLAPPAVEQEMLEETQTEESPKEKGDAKEETESDFIKLNNQFVVPLIDEGQVVSLVVISLSLDAVPGNEEAIYTQEPKLRDAFLRVLFDHANAGGFSGDFTQSSKMVILRGSLKEIAKKTMGDIVNDVLIMDLVRQDT